LDFQVILGVFLAPGVNPPRLSIPGKRQLVRDLYNIVRFARKQIVPVMEQFRKRIIGTPKR